MKTAVLFIIFEFCLSMVAKNAGFGYENRGVSFGLPVWQIEWVSVFLLGGMVFIFRKNILTNRGLRLMFAGGVANLAKRWVWGAVWDYVGLMGLWFNLADVAIVLGVILWIDERDRDPVGK